MKIPAEVIDFVKALRSKHGLPEFRADETVRLRVRDPITNEVTIFEWPEESGRKIVEKLIWQLAEIEQTKYLKRQVARGRCTSFKGCDRKAAGPLHLCDRHRRAAEREAKRHRAHGRKGVR